VASSIILAGWVVLTGALHVDGFMDSCDGLLIHADRERRLEIMSDSRVGGFGVVGGALLLLTKYSALVTLANWARPVALIMAPTLGRAAMSLAILAFPSARREGMGYLIKTQARWHHAALAVGQAAVVSALAGGMLGLMFAAIAGLATLGLGAWMNSRLNGLTGDTYGALAESVELLVLLTLTVKGVW
jgi:adenosylcobinamide-GDP ribazoletransferase